MPTLRTLAPLGLGLGLALLLAGCSGGGTTSSQGASSDAPAASAAPQPSGSAGARADGNAVSGKIAYVSGQLMQVQDTSMQTAVGWTASTTISAEQAGKLADVVKGVCVTATEALTAGTGGSGGTGGTGAAPTAEPTASGTVARVTITDPVDGACTAGFGGFGGGTGTRPGGMPTAMPGGQGGGQNGEGGAPQGVPTARPSGGFGNAARAFGRSGLVTAVSGSTITLRTTGQDGATSSETVTVGSSTTYTKTVKATASAIVVGQCATAFGKADSSGQVAATSITVSSPTNGECASFGSGRGAGLTGSRTGGAGGYGYRNRGGNGGAGNGTSTGAVAVTGARDGSDV